MKLDIIEVSSEDWSVLYVDGKRTEYEGHSLCLMDMTSAINEWIRDGNNITGKICYDNWYINQEYMEEGLPELLSEIPEEMFE